MKSTSRTRNLRIAGAKRMVREYGPLIGMIAPSIWVVNGLTKGRWNPISTIVAVLILLFLCAAYGYIKNPVFAKKTDSEPEP